MTEIARDWWDFKYLAERNPEDPATERIIFYGPDPNSDSEWSWDSACIYRYDPAISDPAERIEKITECINGGSDWIWGPSADSSEAEGQTPGERLGVKARCEAEGELFVGGESVSELAQTQNGAIFVAGNFRMKTAGSFSCAIKIETVDHCNTVDPAHDTLELCEAGGGQWMVVTEACSDPVYAESWECEENGASWAWGVGPQWYDSITGSACLTTDDPALVDEDAGVYYASGWTVEWLSCQPNDPDQWDFTQSVEGFALLTSAEDGGATELKLLSGVDEEVEAFWVVQTASGTRFYYSIYAFGMYSLRSAHLGDNGEVERRTILSDYEVYNVMPDPADTNRILFDGLYFATNSYMFGSVDATLATEEEMLASIEVVGGYTGTIDTLIIFPSW